MSRFRSYLLVVLVAVYPVQAIYTHNVQELDFSQLLMPVIASLAMAALVFTAWRIFTGKPRLAGLLTAIFMLFFWYFGIMREAVSGIIPPDYRIMMPFAIILYGMIAYGVLKIRKPDVLEKLNAILIVPVSLLVVFNLITLVPAEVQKYRIQGAEREAGHIHDDKTFTPTGHQPDIYILVFDEFASIPTMQEVWGYDHSNFVNALHERGFFVAKNSKTRHTNTLRTLPSLMNLTYLDEDLTAAQLYQEYDNNFLMNFLDRAGYEIFFIDGWGSFEYSFSIEDINFYCMYNTDPEADVIMDPFHYLVMRQTMLSPLTTLFRDNTSNLYYRVNNYFLNYIESFPGKANAREHPTLLYSHLMTPHLPFVFDRHGNFMENPTNYWEYESIDNDTKKELYFEQYLYISDRILDITYNILSSSDQEPVIILLSDHGVREQSTGATGKEHSHRVLNAIYFPGGDYSMLYDDIAPVNTLRVMMNQYFNQNYVMLDDT